jgi:hypothetical protein
MLLITAGNVTGQGQLEKDGLANYTVWVGINRYQIWSGPVNGHIRDEGAAELLRRIAEAMDNQKSEPTKESPVHEVLIRILEAPQCPKCQSYKLSCPQGHIWEIPDTK